MKIQSLHIFFSLLVPDMTHEEKQLLDEAMVICYQEKESPMITRVCLIRQSQGV
ncbi:MAG: hypothetical protein ACLS61_05970 [Ruminococcus sp.]